MLSVILDSRVQNDLAACGKSKQFEKQLRMIREYGTSYNSLNFEIVRATKKFRDPKRVYSFRVTGSYRAYCTKPHPNVIKIILVDNHKYPFK